MKLDIMYVLFSCLIFLFVLFARENRDSAKAILLTILLGNIVNFTYITTNFNKHFIEIFFLEFVIVLSTLIIIKILDAITDRAVNIFTTIVELLSSFGLCYIFYIGEQIVIYILTFFHEL